MEISEELKNFLSDPKINNLINNNEYTEVYKEITKFGYNRNTGILTQLFYSVHIDPLKYMDTIPNSYLTNADIDSFSIPEHIKIIGADAFSRCKNLKSITIPNSVTSIGDYAFSSCTALADITIPNSVTSIGDWAFAVCSSLKSIVIPNGVTSIGARAFSDCDLLTSIIIPDSVINIGGGAFYGCESLTNLTLGKNIQNVAISFIDRTNITQVKYNNTMKNWKKVFPHVYDQNDLISKCTIFCIDGTLRVKDIYNAFKGDKIWIEI